MLGRLILLLLQIAIAWYAAPFIAGHIPVPGDFSLFLYAVIYAIIVFLVGLIAAQVLRDIGTPSSATLSWSLIFALIGAALAIFGPQFLPDVPWHKVPDKVLVLAGAVIGYLIKR
jgi:hypothetical protein